MKPTESVKLSNEAAWLNQGKSSNRFSMFFQNKHVAAMKRVEELLGQCEYNPGIGDSWNCGKFNKNFLDGMRSIVRMLFGSTQ
jgi:hypothetical protein